MLQESPLPSHPLTGEPSHITHFAKTLRLSSDQLVSSLLIPRSGRVVSLNFAILLPSRLTANSRPQEGSQHHHLLRHLFLLRNGHLYGENFSLGCERSHRYLGHRRNHHEVSSTSSFPHRAFLSVLFFFFSQVRCSRSRLCCHRTRLDASRSCQALH